MAFTTYSELQTTLASWLNRSDLTSQLPDFIKLAEAEMNRNLSEDGMEVEDTLTLTNGAATLPNDVLDLITVKVGDFVLEPLSDREQAKIVAASRPYGVSVKGNALQVAGASDDTVTILYRQKVPALSDANPTNWVLEDHPDAYLYGSLSHAELFLVNDDRLPMFKSLFAEALGQINRRAMTRMVQQASLTSAVGVGL